MVLLLAVHSVQSVTAKIPFSMVALLDLVKKNELPSDIKCRQVFPTSGLRSTSLWDAPSIETLQIWLDEFLDVDCTNEVFEVQEDFTFGISAELTRLRTTERVTTQGRAIAAAVSERTKPATDAASQHINDINSKYHVSEQTSAAIKAAQERSKLAAQQAAAAVSKMSVAARAQYSKAFQNERVAAVTTTAGSTANSLGSQLQAGWRSLGATIPSWRGQPGSGVPTGDAPVSTPGSHGGDSETGHVWQSASNSGPSHNEPAKASSRPAASSQPTAAPSTLQDPAPPPAKQGRDSLFTLDDLEGGEERAAQELPASSGR